MRRRHEAGGLELVPLAAAQRLGRRLLHPDVEQAEGVQARPAVARDARVEAVGAPRGGEEDDGHRLAEAVQLQAARAHRVEHARVVDHPHGDAQLVGAQLEIRVSGSPERIADDEEGDVLVLCAAEDLVGALGRGKRARGDGGWGFRAGESFSKKRGRRRGIRPRRAEFGAARGAGGSSGSFKEKR